MDYQKILFLHVPKTAGSTVMTYLARAYQGREILRLRFQDGGLNNVDADAVRQASYIWLHAPLRELKHDTNRFRRITFLRDPVERIKSLYFYLRNPQVIGRQQFSQTPPQAVESLRRIEQMTLDEFICSDDPYHSRRLQSVYPFYLASRIHDDPRLALEDALESLDKNFAFVGLTSALAEGLDYLRGQFFPTAVPYNGTRVNRSQRNDVVIGQRASERLGELIASDAVVYATAQAAYAKLGLGNLSSKDNKGAFTTA